MSRTTTGTMAKPRKPALDFHTIGRAGTELLLQTGWLKEQDKLAAQRQKAAVARHKEARRRVQASRRKR